MDALVSYTWPGNVRELKSAFEFAVVSCPGGMIDTNHLPPHVLTTPSTRTLPRIATHESLDDVTRRRLVDALNRTGGNRSEAARLLGISRTSVWNQLKKYRVQL